MLTRLSALASRPENRPSTEGAPEQPTLLDVCDLSLAYGQSVVVEELSLQAGEGQVVCVMGRNGAGKTTLLKGIVGAMRPRGGRVVFAGKEMTRRPSYDRARAGLGYVPQGRGIFPHLNVLENLLVGLEPVNGKDTGQLEEMFALFPVLKQMQSRTAGVLSGGQQQQLAIARALMGRPRLLVLDEPTEGIQPSIVEEIERVIAGLRGTVTVLLVEQFLDFAFAVADHCYVVERGTVALEGHPTQLDEERLREYLAV